MKILNTWKSDEQIKEYYEEEDCVFEYGDYRIFKRFEKSYLHTYKNIAFNCLGAANKEHLINVAKRRKPNKNEAVSWLYDRAIEIIKKGIKILSKSCTATHPDMPNYSGHARGRKLHYAKDEKMTFCNMLVDDYVGGNRLGHYKNNGICKSCLKAMN